MAFEQRDISLSRDYIQHQSVKLLFQHAWLMSLIVGLTATSFTAYMFWHHASDALILGWFILINLVIFTRIGLIIVFKKQKPDTNQLPAWGRYYQYSAWLNGLCWGLPALFLKDQSLPLIFFYSMVISGFVAGAIPGLSFNIRAFYGFAFFSVAPLILQLMLMESVQFQTLGILAILFLLINTASAKISHRRIIEQIQLEFENRHLVEKLKQEKINAERANAVKSQFLAAASHDLRQPMHALGLFVDALDQRIRYPEVKKILDNIKLSTHSLTSLLNSLLDISRLEAGVLKADISTFPLQRIFDQLELELRSLANKKNLSLRIRPCNIWVSSDYTLLTRILRNLLNNAIRYTDKGGVMIGCRLRQQTAQVEIYDTGLGILPENLPDIFDEFYQINNPQRDRRQGLGLGLSIVKRLANLLGHSVEVLSNPNQGSRFSVVLPIAKKPQSQPITQEDDYIADVSGHLVMILDDDSTILEAMTQLLNDWQCQTLTAETIDQAKQIVESQSVQPDLLIADYRLRNHETGIQAIAELNQLLKRPAAGIIVTGDTAPERLKEADASGYFLIHKPVSAAKLRSVMSYIFSQISETDR